MTRRPVKGFPSEGYRWGGWILDSTQINIKRCACVTPESNNDLDATGSIYKRCPYGQPGDRLWVRESHFLFGRWAKNGTSASGKQKWKFVPDRSMGAMYPDDQPIKICKGKKETGWYRRPSIHMPRWASRIMLEIVSVRVERVQEISWMDTVYEGFPRKSIAMGSANIEGKRWFYPLWDSIYGKGAYSWDKNPFVWVIEFKKERE